MYGLNIDPNLVGEDVLVSSSATGDRRNPKRYTTEKTFRAKYHGEEHDYVMIKEEVGPYSVGRPVVEPNIAAGLTLNHLDITAPNTMPDPSVKRDHVVYVEHLEGYDLLGEHPGYQYGSTVFENFLDVFSSEVLIGDTDISDDDLLIDTETGDVAAVDFTGAGNNKIENVFPYMNRKIRRVGRIFDGSINIDESDFKDSLTKIADKADLESIEEDLSRTPRLEGYYGKDTILENIRKVRERGLRSL